MGRTLESPDELPRRVLFAVELLDPVSQTLVQSGVEVRAEGLENPPIVNYSGRFVWLEEGDRWPASLRVTTWNVPFLAHVTPAPPRPADLATAPADERLLRIGLRPAPAYPFEAGVTAVRGRVVEGLEAGSPAVAGALVQLAWFDKASKTWLPLPPAGMGSDAASPVEVETDKHGQFGVFLRLRAKSEPDIDGGRLLARLQVTRGGAGLSTRVTPANFEFVAGRADGRLPEGAPLSRDLKLAWTELTLI